MIAAAHDAGADYIKLQSFVMEDFFSPMLDYYDETASFELSFDQQKELFAFARERGISLISTAFDVKSADYLDQFNIEAYKIASMDLNNYPLIRHVAAKGKPVFLASGMASLEEIESAVNNFKQAGGKDFALLHCVSDYPANIEDINLRFMLRLKELFGCPVGLSDHTLGLDSALMAASLGATIIEKHFTTNRDLAADFPGADHDISIVPEELKQLRAFCERVPVILGASERTFTENEYKGMTEMRRGWYARKDISSGKIFSLENVVALRPVRGIPVSEEKKVLGKKSVKDIKRGVALQYKDIDG